MSCTVTALTTARDSSPSSSARSSSVTPRIAERTSLLNRARRHSYHTLRRRTSVCNADAVFARVDIFLAELRRRVDRLERYRYAQKVHFDAQLERGYSALQDVRDSCTYANGELLWGAAKQRATILVDTLETQYTDVMPSRETLEQKAQVSMRMMENYLADLEGVVQARQKLISAVFDESRRRVDHSLAATREILEDGYEQARKAKAILKESVSRALVLAKETRLLQYDDLPIPWRCNPHIIRGYRFSDSKLECITSVFLPSNETVNIWSHFIGLVVVLALAFHFYPASAAFPMSSKWDVLIAIVFFAAACKCLICSTMWHTMNSIADDKLLARFACVDYTGISLLVAASILTSEWTAFYCEPVSRTVYMSITAILGIAGTILPWRPVFNRPDLAWARVAFYVSLATTGFAPAIQLILTRGSAWSFYFYAPLFKSVSVYFLGAIIYAMKIPERWFPGFFDYCGGSHNIWHLAVLGGIFTHYAAMMQFFNGAFKRAAEEGCSIR